MLYVKHNIILKFEHDSVISEWLTGVLLEDHMSVMSDSLSGPESIVVHRKKPVARIQDSEESEGENEADSVLKENNLKFLEDAFPSLDKMVSNIIIYIRTPVLKYSVLKEQEHEYESCHWIPP